MGWLWSSPAPQASPGTSGSQSPTPQSIPSEASTTRKPTRDELAESEFLSLLEELEADLSPSSSKYNSVPQPLPPHIKPSSSQTATPATKPTAKYTLEDELLPKEMSCRQAFDAAFYCQSFGGQFNHVYRFGSIRSCSENWSDFWFCMRSKSFATAPGPGGVSEKEEKIRNHYKRKMLRYKVGPSSEDVWESREERLPWGEAFSMPVEEAERVSDEEWNVREKERRERRVRELDAERS